METDRSKILARIQKMMTLGMDGGATEAEAATAMAFAQRLMVEHQIEAAEVSAHEKVADDWVEELAGISFMRSPHSLFVNDILRTHFFVQTWRQPIKDGKERYQRFYLFGSRDNVHMAKYVYNYLDGIFPSLWIRRKHLMRLPEADRRTYYLGVWAGFGARITEERRVVLAERKGPGTALALVENKLKLAFAEKHPDMKTGHSAKCKGSRQAYEAGHTDGKNLNIRRPLDGPGQARKAIG
jgi:hypothetical protein